MINEIERWKQYVTWLDDMLPFINTMIDGEDTDGAAKYVLKDVIGKNVFDLVNHYERKIKSRETLKSQLQDSLSQATDGGRE
jgi:hypothetical protein